ncbi:MAG TPA: protease modulator HflK [Verrucomicrobiae bacterium]|nr:protease modulator HflK [Verrucomicrobiae bacterium]
MSDHDHHDHLPAPGMQDSGSQALAEALQSSFVIVKIAMVALVVIIFAAGFFQVGPAEKAIVLRFGKPQGEGPQMLLGAGLHWSLPYPIDEVVHIPVTPTLTVRSTVGWYFTTPEQELAGTEPPAGPSLDPRVDGYTLTADRNIVHARATVTYVINDPRTAIFNFASGTNHEFNLNGISNAVVNAANNAIIATSARFNVDDILINKQAEFQDAVQQYISDLADNEHLGVTITQCAVEKTPPRQLKDIFAQVASARQNREKLIYEAKGEETRILSQAGARASSITNAAESASLRYVTGIQSDAEVFASLLPRYVGNPTLFSQLEVTKAMSVVLANVGEKKYIHTHADGKPVELRLMLNNELPQSKSGSGQ